MEILPTQTSVHHWNHSYGGRMLAEVRKRNTNNYNNTQTQPQVLPREGLIPSRASFFFFFFFFYGAVNEVSRKRCRGRSCQLCEVEMLTGRGAARMLDFCIVAGTLVRWPSSGFVQLRKRKVAGDGMKERRGSPAGERSDKMSHHPLCGGDAALETAWHKMQKIHRLVY